MKRHRDSNPFHHPDHFVIVNLIYITIRYACEGIKSVENDHLVRISRFSYTKVG